jgi:hypothetical protein
VDDSAVLTQTFSERKQQIASTDVQDGESQSRAEQLEFAPTSIEHKLELLGMSTVVGKILRQRQAQLPAHGELSKQIADNSDYIMTSSLRQELVKKSNEDTEASIENGTLQNDPNLLSDECTKLLNLLTMFGCLLGVLWIWTHSVFGTRRSLSTVGKSPIPSPCSRYSGLSRCQLVVAAVGCRRTESGYRIWLAANGRQFYQRPDNPV